MSVSGKYKRREMVKFQFKSFSRVFSSYQVIQELTPQFVSTASFPKYTSQD